jgi:PAS domain S-box-containing protein
MSRATLLIVEDEEIVVADLASKLDRLGYSVSGSTARGEEAVSLARQSRPDLVLMDIQLKGRMDGIEAAEQLRRECDLPVVYLTAHSDRTTLQRAKLTEPFGYILKPFEELELETHIEMALYKHQAERKLRESEALYRAIGESINYGIWVCDPGGRNLYASPSFLQLVGLTQEECSEGGCHKALHPDDAQRAIGAWKECVRTGGIWDMEHRFRGVDGQWHPILARGVPVRDQQGQITRWAGIHLDISRLRQAQADLEASNQELEAFNRRMVGRELRMIELKKEIDALCVRFGQPPRYGYARSEEKR